MKIKPRQTMAQNKLLLLYLLEKSGMELSELQIIRIMGELDFMRYFDLKECLFELEQNRDITLLEYPHKTAYIPTEKGSQMLSVLAGDIRASFKERIDEYIRAHKTALEIESHFVGEYTRLSENEYRVTLKVLETSRAVFEISLIVYSKDEAEKITADWPTAAVSVYKEVITRLTHPDRFT